MNKQIEEMAIDLSESIVEVWNNNLNQYVIDGKATAENMINEGYRKERDVARKIFEEIDRVFTMHFCSCSPQGSTEHYNYYEGDLADDIAELKNKWIKYKVWVDDCRAAPNGYIWFKTVNDTVSFILEHDDEIALLDLDHDASDEYSKYGGDYIELLNWLERTGRSYPIRIHSMNPVGAENMRRIIEKNGWKEIR